MTTLKLHNNFHNATIALKITSDSHTLTPHQIKKLDCGYHNCTCADAVIVDVDKFEMVRDGDTIKINKIK